MLQILLLFRLIDTFNSFSFIIASRNGIIIIGWIGLRPIGNSSNATCLRENYRWVLFGIYFERFIISRKIATLILFALYI